MSFSSKKTYVRHKTELVLIFAELVTTDHRIRGLSLALDNENHPSEVVLTLDGNHFKFSLRYLLTPTSDDLEVPRSASPQPVLIVVPRLTPAFLQLCRQKEVSVADLNGQFFLRAPGVVISLPGLPGRDFRYEIEPRNVYVGKSVRIVRTLLTDPDRFWQQAELVQRTSATSGLVSRVVTHLARQGLLKKVDARRFQVTNLGALLGAWAEADDFSRRTTTYRFAALSSDNLKLAKTIRNVLTHSGPAFAFTQWIAAWLRHPYTEPPVLSLYVQQLPLVELLAQIGLHRVEDGGRVWIHVPTDDGVFQDRRFVDTLPLVTDAQIYVDLVKTGLRGPEQAKALRDWSGFCKQ